MLVEQLNEHLVDRKLHIALTQEVVDSIIELTCKDRSYGARPLRRAIQRYIEDPLSEELIRGLLSGGEIEVYLDSIMKPEVVAKDKEDVRIDRQKEAIEKYIQQSKDFRELGDLIFSNIITIEERIANEEDDEILVEIGNFEVKILNQESLFFIVVTIKNSFDFGQ